MLIVVCGSEKGACPTNLIRRGCVLVVVAAFLSQGIMVGERQDRGQQQVVRKHESFRRCGGPGKMWNESINI